MRFDPKGLSAEDVRSLKTNTLAQAQIQVINAGLERARAEAIRAATEGYFETLQKPEGMTPTAFEQLKAETIKGAKAGEYNATINLVREEAATAALTSELASLTEPQG
jgi:hypothetical protein